MKTLKMAVAMVLIATHVLGADVLTQKLQQGLFEEEANRNPDAAIKSYQAVVQQGDEQRKVVATALFRLAECYRKLGRTNEAAAHYARVARDFSDQEQLAQLSRPHLPTKHASAVAVTTDPATIKLLREELAVAEQHLSMTMRARDAGKLREKDVLQAMRDVLRAKRLLPENESAEKQREAIEEQIRFVTDLLKSTTRKIEAGVIAPGDELIVKRELLALQRELALVGSGGAAVDAATGAATPSPAEMTQEEAELLAKVKGMAQDSPDLLNAQSTYVSGGDGAVTPLHRAALKGYSQVAEFLLNNGADPNLYSPIVTAADHGHRRIVEQLLAKGANPNAGSGRGGETALMSASGKGYKSIVELLLEHGAEVNREISPPTHLPGGYTALHFAAYSGHAAIVDLLTKRGAAVDKLPASGMYPAFRYASSGGATPLHLAAGRGYPTVVELLLKAGASADIKNHDGETPLFRAVSGGYTNIAGMLLVKGADINHESSTGNTPLTLALNQSQTPIVEFLASAGANVNKAISQRSRGGPPGLGGGEATVPIHIAVLNASTTTVEQMLKHGADPNVPLKDAGRTLTTPLRYATRICEGMTQAPSQSDVRQRFCDIAELLRRHGAKEDVSQNVTNANAPLLYQWRRDTNGRPNLVLPQTNSLERLKNPVSPPGATPRSKP